MKPITQEWTEKAEGDYRVAADQWEKDKPVYDAICFHAQQCIEKYLKAWLVEHEIDFPQGRTARRVVRHLKAWLTEHEIDFPRIHDLELLGRLCIPSLPEMSELLDRLRLLTSFAVEVRYPGITAEKEDAEMCWQAAMEIREPLRIHLR